MPTYYSLERYFFSSCLGPKYGRRQLPGLRATIKRFAIFEGHEVTEAGDGLEAMGLCRSNTFDSIIMDITLPGLDGFSAVKKIWELMIFGMEVTCTSLSVKLK